MYEYQVLYNRSISRKLLKNHESITNVQLDIDNSTVNNLEKNSESDSDCESDKIHLYTDCNKFNTIIVYQEVKVPKSKN